MKKYLILTFFIFISTVNASKVYLFKSNDKTIIKTKNDYYDYNDYILNDNQVLLVAPENGIISNDVLNTMNYKIRVFENSENSNLNDLEYNETTGSFTYSPSNSVSKDVSFKYYIESDNYKSNISFIYFYINNKSVNYTINYYDAKTNKIISSITKNSNVNDIVTEKPIIINGYYCINNIPITKKLTNSSNDNIFNFYYEKIPNTGI